MENEVKDGLKNEVKKENKLKKKILGLPKVVKKIIIVIGVLVIFYLGIKFGPVFTAQTKTTKLGLEDVGELVTQTGYLTVVQDNKENRSFFQLFDIPFTESRQIFSYDVEVDASVDFSQITYTADNKKGEITIKLPHAKIYKATLNPDSLKVYLDSESLFSRIDLSEHNDALKTMQEQAIKDAEANGILDSADENAKTLIESFIKSNNEYKDYNVNYEYIGG